MNISSILNGQELARGIINYGVIPTYFPVNTTFPSKCEVIPTALSKTNFSGNVPTLLTTKHHETMYNSVRTYFTVAIWFL